MKKAVALLCYSRFDYVQRVVSSLLAQTIGDQPLASEYDIHFFQDGLWPGESEEGQAGHARVRALLSEISGQGGARFISQSENLSIALHFDLVERDLFEVNGYDLVVFFEDDMVLAPGYMAAMNAMAEQFAGDPRVGMFSAHSAGGLLSESEQLAFQGQPFPMGHSWGFGLYRNFWGRRQAFVDLYLQWCRAFPYRHRPSNRINQWLERCGFRGHASSQDYVKQCATTAVGGVRVASSLNFGLPIGEKGTHFSPSAFRAMGLDRMTVCTRPQGLDRVFELDDEAYRKLWQDDARSFLLRPEEFDPAGWPYVVTLAALDPASHILQIVADAAIGLASDSDVVACYKFFLGRLPENEQVVKEQVGKPLQRVLEAVLSSQEFGLRSDMAVLMEQGWRRFFPPVDTGGQWCNQQPKWSLAAAGAGPAALPQVSPPEGLQFLAPSGQSWSELLQGLDAHDCHALAHFSRCLLLTSPNYQRSRLAYLAMIRDKTRSSAFRVLAGTLNAWCRDACCKPDVTMRWLAWQRLLCAANAFSLQFSSVVAAMAERPDGAHVACMWSQPMLLPEPEGHAPESAWAVFLSLSAPNFVAMAVEAVLMRGCHPSELADHVAALAKDSVSARQAVLDRVFRQLQLQLEHDVRRLNDSGESFWVMGTQQKVRPQDWQARAEQLGLKPASDHVSASKATDPPPKIRARADGQPVVTAIASLYRGAAYIERFLRNMVDQVGFDQFELLIIDASSPEGESATIEKYTARYPNIRYHRLDSRVGIYEAWNLGVQLARGDYLTSTNLDDLRRRDSLALQAQALDTVAAADVVYQNFYYTMDATLDFDEIASFDYVSVLPEQVTPLGLLQCNPPHNAPMWRRSLHRELGLFDARLSSAADYDFWMRCVLAGKQFLKLDQVHVAYYQNPQGLSTRPDGRGHLETRLVHQRYMRQLMAAGPGVAAGAMAGQTLALGVGHG